MNGENSNSNGHKIEGATNIKIPVPWGNVSGKLWGSKDEQPIVAIHGWQDNAGTFDTLAPLLASSDAILCIDLPGHGLSSHHPDGQFYYVFWDGVVLLRRIVKHYKWDKVQKSIYTSDCNFIMLVNKKHAFLTEQAQNSERLCAERGKWWGPIEVQPILALHGRQDNAGSYDTLMPILAKDVSILCLDLPGHGLSSHLPKGQYYYLHWDGVMLLRRIVRHFRWTKVKLMGHSLGGAISFLYAAMYPDEVEFVISLDIASPCVRSPSKVAQITGDQIDKYLKYETLSLDSQPCYGYEEMIDIVFGAHNGSITKESAEILMKRGMQPARTRGQYYFSRDSRLKVSLLGAMSMDLALEYAARIKCAYLNIRALPGLEFEEPDNYTKILDVIKQGSKRFEYHEVEGTHHVHLNNPERISDILEKFIKG